MEQISAFIQKKRDRECFEDVGGELEKMRKRKKVNEGNEARVSHYLIRIQMEQKEITTYAWISLPVRLIKDPLARHFFVSVSKAKDFYEGNVDVNVGSILYSIGLGNAVERMGDIFSKKDVDIMRSQSNILRGFLLRGHEDHPNLPGEYWKVHSVSRIKLISVSLDKPIHRLCREISLSEESIEN